nr:hypothetical protein [uncultured bacterium]
MQTGDPMTEFPETLSDQMSARVYRAGLAVDRHSNATRRRWAGPERARPASPNSPSLEEVRQSQSLRRVFRELGGSYRRYRSQTGGRVAPGLREAAHKFRAEPSLANLVAVARFLDELDLLS